MFQAQRLEARIHKKKGPNGKRNVDRRITARAGILRHIDPTQRDGRQRQICVLRRNGSFWISMCFLPSRADAPGKKKDHSGICLIDVCIHSHLHLFFFLLNTRKNSVYGPPVGLHSTLCC